MQTQPPKSPDTNMNTALVMTKAAGEVARKIDRAISPRMLSGREITLTSTGANGKVITTTYTEPDYAGTKGWYQFGDYVNVLFFCLVGAGVVHFIWSLLNSVIDFGTSESHEDRVQRLYNGELLKRGMRLAVLLFLGLATWAYQYYPSASGKLTVAGMTFLDASSVEDTASPWVNLMNPIGLIAAAPGANPAADSSISGTIAKASAKLGAWHFARQSITTTARTQAINAAETFWNSVHPAGTSPTMGPPVGNPAGGPTGELGSDVGSIAKLFNLIGNSIVSYGMSVLLLFMNFGLDVMIVRTLMFNAIYMLIAYKVAVMLLPLALVAAYWYQWDGVLRGVIQIMIVTFIGLNVLADMTAIVVSPEQVQAIITEANAQSLSTDKQAEMMKFVKAEYAKMTAGGEVVTWEQYKSQVVNDIGKDINVYMFNLDATFWAPVRVFLMLTIMITLVGKIGLVISDTISGTMSYHRG